MPMWRYLERGGKRAIGIWHRRAGKDDVMLHRAAVAAFERPATYWHCLPEYAQARKAIWNAVNPHTGRRRIDEAFPHELRSNTNDQEMFIRFKNGSTWQVIGSDRYNGLVGAGVAGVTFSEWALCNPSAWGFISPMMRENNGWAVFITTPRGQNHAKQMYESARKNPDWFAERLSVRDTKAYSPAELAEIRQTDYIDLFGEDFGQAQYEQEYEVSFNAAILGAFYAREMAEVRASGRIVGVDPEPGYPVHTAWDLGMRDSTAIWWFQVVGNMVCVVDCYASHGQGIQHYADVIKGKPYLRGVDYVPHDARVKELGTGRTRLEVMIEHGLNPQVVPMMSKMDGIQAVRQTLPRCVFSDKCEEGLSALEQYRREWDDERKTFRDHEVHDWTSHYCVVAGTRITTTRGEVAVEDVREGDFAITPTGPCLITAAGVSKLADELIEIETGAGVLMVTPDHPVFTTRGVVRSDALRYGDEVITPETAPWIASANEGLTGYRAAFIASFAGSGTGSGQGEAITSARMVDGNDCCTGKRSGIWGAKSCLSTGILKTSTQAIGKAGVGAKVGPVWSSVTSSILTALHTIANRAATIVGRLTAGRNTCTAPCGKGTTGQSQTGTTSITSTRTRATTVSKTYRSSPLRSIYRTMRAAVRGSEVKTTSGNWMRFASRLRNGTQARPALLGTAKTESGHGNPGHGTTCNARSAALHTGRHTRPAPSIAGKIVGLRRYAVADVPVYDLTVERDGCYFANGLLVSNCDAFRYLASAWRTAPDIGLDDLPQDIGIGMVLRPREERRQRRIRL